MQRREQGQEATNILAKKGRLCCVKSDTSSAKWNDVLKLVDVSVKHVSLTCAGFQTPFISISTPLRVCTASDPV